MTLTVPAGKRKARTRVVSDVENQSARLLAWYDRHRRDLPWRVPAGEPRDPYRVWVSEIMLQQTTVRAVVPYYLRFLERFPTVKSLAGASLDEVLRLWAGLGYYARGRNLHACARAIVDRHGGEFPRSLAELRALPGIGDYTAAAIAAIAYDEPVIPVDGNIERVVARLFAIDAPLPRAKPAIRRAAAGLVPSVRPGDFVQALMDLGATVCTPKGPACLHCPLRGNCLAQAAGAPESLPVKAAKRQGRLRRGAAFVVLRDDGAVLLRNRPAKGLLGGMTEVPTSEWIHDFDERKALDHAPALSSAKTLRAQASRIAEPPCGVLRLASAPSATQPRARGRESSIAGKLAQPAQAWLRARGDGARTRRQGLNQDLLCPDDPLCAGGERNAIWRRIPGTVTHTFTHFPLELIVYVGKARRGAKPPAGTRWAAGADLAGEALSGVMRKVLAHAGINLS